MRGRCPARGNRGLMVHALRLTVNPAAHCSASPFQQPERELMSATRISTAPTSAACPSPSARRSSPPGLVEGSTGAIRVRTPSEGDGLFKHACLMGLEGIISKRADRPYRSGRYDDWVKIRRQSACPTLSPPPWGAEVAAALTVNVSQSPNVKRPSILTPSSSALDPPRPRLPARPASNAGSSNSSSRSGRGPAGA